MKGHFEAEAIGYSIERDQRAGGRLAAAVSDLIGLDRKLLAPPASLNPWCARITGPDLTYGLAREFLQPKVDWSRSNSVGSRGVYFCWTLETGEVYEAKYRTSWNGGFVRAYLRVTADGDVERIDRAEVQRWLDAASASTS